MSVQNIVSYCQRENYSLWLLCCVADTSRVYIFFFMSQLMTLWLKVMLRQFGETSAELSL